MKNIVIFFLCVIRSLSFRFRRLEVKCRYTIKGTVIILPVGGGGGGRGRGGDLIYLIP